MDEISIQFTIHMYTKHIESIQIEDYVRFKFKQYLNLCDPTDGIFTLT